MLNSAEHAQLSWAWKGVLIVDIFIFMTKWNFMLSWAWKKFYNLGVRLRG